MNDPDSLKQAGHIDKFTAQVMKLLSRGAREDFGWQYIKAMCAEEDPIAESQHRMISGGICTFDSVEEMNEVADKFEEQVESGSISDKVGNAYRQRRNHLEFQNAVRGLYGGTNIYRVSYKVYSHKRLTIIYTTTPHDAVRMLKQMEALAANIEVEFIGMAGEGDR